MQQRATQVEQNLGRRQLFCLANLKMNWSPRNHNLGENKIVNKTTLNQI